MGNHARQALEALAVYKRRGLEAERALADGDHAGAEKILKLRSAAFHNFRAQDHLALQEGLDLAADEAMNGMVEELSQIEGRLLVAIRQAQKASLGEVSKLNTNRRAIGSYRSGHASQTRAKSFEQTV